MMTRDRVAATALLIFGLAAAFEAHRLAIGDPARPGPGFFPFWLGVTLCIAAVGLLLHRAPTGGQPRAIPTESLRRDKVVLTLLGGLAYALVVESVGFSVTTFAFLVFLLTVIEPQRRLTSVVISAVTTAACYVVFTVWLAVQLPVGPWGF